MVYCAGDNFSQEVNGKENLFSQKTTFKFNPFFGNIYNVDGNDATMHLPQDMRMFFKDEKLER